MTRILRLGLCASDMLVTLRGIAPTFRHRPGVRLRPCVYNRNGVQSVNGHNTVTLIAGGKQHSTRILTQYESATIRRRLSSPDSKDMMLSLVLKASQPLSHWRHSRVCRA